MKKDKNIEENVEAFRMLLRGEIDKVEFSCYEDEGFLPFDVSKGTRTWEFLDFIKRFNIRRKPQPKFRPWKPEEVPVDGWIRYKSSPQLHRYGIDVNTGCVWFTNCNGETELLDRQGLFSSFEHSDDGASWLPCGVEE